MRSALIAASLVGATFASASTSKTAAPAESTVVKKFGADALAYDTKVIDPNTAADIKAVVENRSAPSAILARRTDLVSQSAAVKSSKSVAPKATESSVAASTKKAPKATDKEKASSASKKQDVVSPSGYTGPIEIGQAAINALVDCNGQYTYMGFEMFEVFNPDTFNIQLCANVCSQTTENEIVQNTQTTEVMYCQFFNTYMLYQNGNSVGQICAMYSETWGPAYATNRGQVRESGNYTISDSYISSNATNPAPVPSGAACGDTDLTFPPETTGSSSNEDAATTEVASSSATSETEQVVTVTEPPETVLVSTTVETSEELTTTLTYSFAFIGATTQEPEVTIESATTTSEQDTSSAESSPATSTPITVTPSASLAAVAGSEYTNMLARILVEQGYEPYCSNMLGYNLERKELTETATDATETLTIPTPYVVYFNVKTTTLGVLVTSTPSAVKAKSTKQKHHKDTKSTSNHPIYGKRQAPLVPGAPAGLAYLNPSLVSAACKSIVTPPPSLNIVTVRATATSTDYSQSSVHAFGTTQIITSFSTVITS